MHCTKLTDTAIEKVVVALAKAGDIARHPSTPGEGIIEQTALEALAAAGVDPRRQSRPTGRTFENDVIKALRSANVGMRRTLHLDIWHKIDFRVTHLCNKALVEPVSVQITLDWDNPSKMRLYKEFVQRERHGREARLYVQVHRGVTAQTAAAHIVDWVWRIQNKRIKRLDAVEILPEGSSAFRINRRIVTIERNKRKLEATRVVPTTIQPLEHLGRIVSINNRFVSVLPDDGTEPFWFDRRSVISSRLLQLMADDEIDEQGNIVSTVDRDRFNGAIVAFAVSDTNNQGVASPHDLVLLSG